MSAIRPSVAELLQDEQAKHILFPDWLVISKALRGKRRYWMPVDARRTEVGGMVTWPSFPLPIPLDGGEVEGFDDLAAFLQMHGRHPLPAVEDAALISGIWRDLASSGNIQDLWPRLYTRWCIGTALLREGKSRGRQ